MKPKMFTTEVTLGASQYGRVALVGRLVTVQPASIRRHKASPAASG